MQAQESLNAEEKKDFKALHKYISAHTKESLHWYWELGVRAKAMYDKSKEETGVYGRKTMQRIAISLNYSTDRPLRNAVHVVEAFGTKKAFEAYIKLSGESGNILNWSHYVQLAHIGNTEERMQQAAATLEQCLTSEELTKRIQDLSTNRKVRGIRTAKTKVPTSAAGALTHMRTQAEKFIANYDKAWTGDAFDLEKAVTDLPADKVTGVLLEVVRLSREKIIELNRCTVAMTELLGQTEICISERMDAQAEFEEAEAEAIAEAAAEDAAEYAEDATGYAEDDGDGYEVDGKIVERNDEGDVIVNVGPAMEQARAGRGGKKGPKRKGRVGV